MTHVLENEMQIVTTQVQEVAGRDGAKSADSFMLCVVGAKWRGPKRKKYAM